MYEVKNQQKPWWLFVGVGLLVGLVFSALYKYTMLHQSIDESGAKKLVAIGIIFAYSGLTILLSYNARKTLLLVFNSFLMSAALALMTCYGWFSNTLYTFYNITILIWGTFAAINLLNIYHQSDYKTPNYKYFFAVLWTNISTILATLILLGMLTLVLVVSTMMLMMVHLTFLNKYLFNNIYFYVLCYPIFFALGLHVCAKWQETLYGFRKIILGFFAILLPVVCIISWIYFVGLVIGFLPGMLHGVINSYYSSGALQLMANVFVGIVFINAVYQDGSNEHEVKAPYRYIVDALVVLLVPMCIFGIWMFVLANQYWYSVLNIVFVAQALLLLAYSVVYLYGFLQRSEAWMQPLRKCNVYMAWVLLFVTVLFNIHILNHILPVHPAKPAMPMVEKHQKIEIHK